MMAMILRRYLPRWYVSCTGCRYSSQASRRGVSTDVWILESECKISLICGHGKKFISRSHSVMLTTHCLKPSCKILCTNFQVC